MKAPFCIFCAALLQITTAHVLPYNFPRNVAPAQVTTNQPTQPTANTNTLQTIPNNGLSSTGNQNEVNGVPLFANNLANTPIASIPMANTQIANTPIANTLNEQVIANPNIVGIIPNSDITNPNTGGVNPNIATLANMASINGNTATFNLGNGGFTVSSGSPGVPSFGIQVLADALEVSGRVAVNGQMPIYGAVSLNGHLPTDGSATVSYNCGQTTVHNNSMQTAPESVQLTN